MLHVVSQSPFSQSTLANCLAFMRDDDQLLLIQDAVIATTASLWTSRLQDKTIYVLQDDLRARGLTNQVGIVIDMSGFVSLVAIHESPLCW